MSRLYPHVLLALAASGLGARAVAPRRPGTDFSDHPETGYDQHAIDWHYHKKHMQLRAERDAELEARRAEREAAAAAKRERDARWINAAEAKRQRKRAKAAAKIQS